MKHIVFIILFQTSFVSSAQYLVPSSTNLGSNGGLWDQVDPVFSNTNYGSLENLKAKGSTYLYEDYTSGYVAVNSDTFQIEVLNYDVFRDELFTRKNSFDVIINKKMVDHFLLREPKSVNYILFKKVQLDGKEIFLQMIYEGDLNLLKKHRKTLVKGGQNAYMATYTLDRIEDKNPEYYLQYDSSLLKLPCTEDELLSFLKDFNSAEVKTCLQENQVKTKKRKLKEQKWINFLDAITNDSDK